MKSNQIQTVCSTGDGASPRASLWIRRESSSSSTSRRRLSFLRSRPRRVRVCRRRVVVVRRRRRHPRHDARHDARRPSRGQIGQTDRTDGSDGSDGRIGPDDPPIEFAGRDRSISSITGPVPSAGRPTDRPTDRSVPWVGRPNARENEPRPESFGGSIVGGMLNPTDLFLSSVISY